MEDATDNKRLLTHLILLDHNKHSIKYNFSLKDQSFTVVKKEKCKVRYFNRLFSPIHENNVS